VARTERSSTQRLTELRSALPYDATLQNLVTVLTMKLDLCARLPIFEYEAESEGFTDSASFFGALASAERTSVNEIRRSLQSHLAATNGRFTAQVGP
jgi:hypothetical protein